MPVIPVIPSHQRQTCSISASGTISFPRRVAEQLGWTVPSKIAVWHLADPLVLLFRPAAGDQAGYSLAYQSRPVTARTGTQLRCATFASHRLGPRVELPLHGLVPLFLPSGDYPLALVVQRPHWSDEAFSQAGLKQIPADLKGVYQLLSASGTVLRIGEGTISERMREHLKEERLTSAVRTLQYFRLADKEETQLWERIVIAQYELQNGQLPPLNRIRA